MGKVNLTAGRGKLPAYHRINRALATAPEPHKRLIELTVNEAEALAWQTGLPDLVFLSLAEEKLDALDRYLARQEKLRVRSAQWSLSE